MTGTGYSGSSYDNNPFDRMLDVSSVAQVCTALQQQYESESNAIGSRSFEKPCGCIEGTVGALAGFAALGGLLAFALSQSAAALAAASTTAATTTAATTETTTVATTTEAITTTTVAPAGRSLDGEQGGSGP
ncbi:uncharacterized protein LOC119104312 [Pollicipes pollicipes]|uniref:uncharacterized protein LOC119104312 n=1 Tax=Pollicipes pollicipes TaxID=41117 RepID=UPI0018852487|nr:uncharacterized protein LOC119104312 [Pollicipes pollicipes]